MGAFIGGMGWVVLDLGVKVEVFSLGGDMWRLYLNKLVLGFFDCLTSDCLNRFISRFSFVSILIFKWQPLVRNGPGPAPLGDWGLVEKWDWSLP